jgi:hypothetical protein
MNYWEMEPHDELFLQMPSGVEHNFTLANPGSDYVTYLIGDRTSNGNIRINLVAGDYLVKCFDPKSATYQSGFMSGGDCNNVIQGSGDTQISIPAFTEDIVIYLQSQEGPVCGDGFCESGENCPQDSVGCIDNVCYEPTCVNGCGESPVPSGQEDPGQCEGDTGCVGGNCYCDGSGNCVSAPPPEPAISNVECNPMGNTRFIITWDTPNVPSTTEVAYGTKDYGSFSDYPWQYRDYTKMINHEAVVNTGGMIIQELHYRVRSEDKYGQFDIDPDEFTSDYTCKIEPHYAPGRVKDLVAAFWQVIFFRQPVGKFIELILFLG